MLKNNKYSLLPLPVEASVSPSLPSCLFLLCLFSFLFFPFLFPFFPSHPSLFILPFSFSFYFPFIFPFPSKLFNFPISFPTSCPTCCPISCPISFPALADRAPAPLLFTRFYLTLTHTRSNRSPLSASESLLPPPVRTGKFSPKKETKEATGQPFPKIAMEKNVDRGGN